MIQIRFGDNFIYLETNKLIPSKEGANKSLI